MGAKIGVLIADDHPLIREGVRKILSTSDDIEVVGEASNGEEAVLLAAEKKPDVILMDINMPVLDGIEATKKIKASSPGTKIIALTIHEQEEYLFELIKAGACGYILKDINPDDLVSAVIGAYRGRSYLPPSMTSKVFEEFNRLAVRQNEKAGTRGLTRREMDVLQLVAKGSSNREIAQMLFISEKTVKNHLTSIFQKLGVQDRTQAALRAIKTGLVDIK